jgi:hypothetical protein
MKDSYSIFEETDRHLVRQKFHTQRESRFYPSEASVVITDQYGDRTVHGGCLRASYFRVTGAFPGTPYDAHSQFIFLQGSAVENMLVDLWKEMGIWHDSHVKFVDKENNISGELDAILVEPPHGQLYGAEVKSFYGYNAKKELFGDRHHQGFPKMNNLLQTLVYLNHFEDRLPYFRLIYFARDSAARKSFRIELQHEGSIKWPKVDGEIVRSFSVDDILARYRLLQQHVNQATVPPNDFVLDYPETTIHDFHAKGKISDSKYEKWQKGKLKAHEHLGNWQCSYCQYQRVCWGAQATGIPVDDGTE